MKRFLFRSLLALSGLALGNVAKHSQAQLATPVLENRQPETPKEIAKSKAELETFGPTEYLRLTKEGNVPKSLDVAVTSFTRPDSSVQVDLIGAIHIGERSYYAELNKLFDQYDVLLYELVAAEGTVIPRGGKREGPEHPIAMIQGMAKSALGLEFQLEQIDYTKKHMVRADLTPEQMSEKMEARGDTPITIALSAFADAMRQQNLKSSKQSAFQEPLPDISLFDLFGSPTKLKRIMAQQFAATGALDQSLGSALNQLLVIDRNGAAIEGLQKEMKKGKNRIGIFYGAAHMPDFERRLTGDLQFVRKSQTWLAAWNLK